jgi:hypothetical protein
VHCVGLVARGGTAPHLESPVADIVCRGLPACDAHERVERLEGVDLQGLPIPRSLLRALPKASRSTSQHLQDLRHDSQVHTPVFRLPSMSTSAWSQTHRLVIFPLAHVAFISGELLMNCSRFSYVGRGFTVVHKGQGTSGKARSGHPPPSSTNVNGQHTYAKDGHDIRPDFFVATTCSHPSSFSWASGAPLVVG